MKSVQYIEYEYSFVNLEVGDILSTRSWRDCVITDLYENFVYVRFLDNNHTAACRLTSLKENFEVIVQKNNPVIHKRY